MTTNGIAIAVMTLLVTGGALEPAPADPGLEAAPVLRAAELAPAHLLKGPRFAVDERVPADLVARFTIRSDFGTLPAHGRTTLAVRVGEIGALDQLERTSKTEEFLKAAGGAAARPVKAAVGIVTSPVETVKGAPAAVDRFLDRVQLGSARVKEAASAPDKSAEERTAAVSRRVGGISADALGYEQERRALAKRLGADPYTTNPVLADKLDEMAWIAFSGRVGTNLAVSIVVPYSIVLSATSVTQDLIWDTKPADLIVLNEQKLGAMGVSPGQAQSLLRNPWYSLTMLTSLVTGLEQLGGVAGREQVVGFAAAASSEEGARLVTEAVQMLVRSHQGQEPIARVTAPGPLVAHTRRGALLVPAPLDYVAWTERVSRFSRRQDLRAKERVAWVTGTVSPRAKQGLAAAGWTVREGP
jgi:hypothetical protein